MVRFPLRARVVGALAAAALAGLCATGCASQPVVPSVATFEIQGQTFRIELATPELVRHAEQLLQGAEVAPIPVGRIVRGSGSVNEPWSWHIDPASLEFADFTTEVCDGLPQFVEDRTLTSDTYCPWMARVVSVEPLR
ncbi:hypothetical protein [Leucobacter chironomi]|uniref:BP74-related protein n=1 Tax=Leucobacter chironomi TaxID=491918 RepID=UPI00040272AB|nr:hypothetical protein [Leucobacter chironomi]